MMNMKKKNNGKTLIVCNTVYQVLVGLWINHHYLSGCKADFIITDHMNGGNKIADRIRDLGLCDNVYYVQSHAFSYYQDGYKQTRAIRFNPNIKLRDFLDLKDNYSTVYIANMDLFAQLLCNSIYHRNRNGLDVVLFEDGIQTYTTVEEKVYKSCCDPVVSGFRTLLSKYVYRDFRINGNIAYALMFSPELMDWRDFPVVQLDKIDRQDLIFRKVINYVFEAEEAIKEYNPKYLFMEEHYAADGKTINDVELIASLAEKVGKDNIMVKIHPRNPVNRFKKLGYHTNTVLSVPWEVIAMNLPDIEEKIFITVQSGSISNLIRIFGMSIQAYSILLLAEQNGIPFSPNRGELERKNWDFFLQHSDMIKICSSIDDIS